MVVMAMPHGATLSGEHSLAPLPVLSPDGFYECWQGVWDLAFHQWPDHAIDTHVAQSIWSAARRQARADGVRFDPLAMRPADAFDIGSGDDPAQIMNHAEMAWLRESSHQLIIVFREVRREDELTGGIWSFAGTGPYWGGHVVDPSRPELIHYDGRHRRTRIDSVWTYKVLGVHEERPG